jgi:hypothetical protein
MMGFSREQQRFVCLGMDSKSAAKGAASKTF